MSLHDLSGHDEKLLKDNTDNADFPFNTRDTVYSYSNCTAFLVIIFTFEKKKGLLCKELFKLP